MYLKSANNLKFVEGIEVVITYHGLRDYIAVCPKLNDLTSYGYTEEFAKGNMVDNICSLYDDFVTDDNDNRYRTGWRTVKHFLLNNIVVEEDMKSFDKLKEELVSVVLSAEDCALEEASGIDDLSDCNVYIAEDLVSIVVDGHTWNKNQKVDLMFFLNKYLSGEKLDTILAKLNEEKEHTLIKAYTKLDITGDLMSLFDDVGLTFASYVIEYNKEGIIIHFKPTKNHKNISRLTDKFIMSATFKYDDHVEKYEKGLKTIKQVLSLCGDCYE